MTIAKENASLELVDMFAEIHNLLSSHGFKEDVHSRRDEPYP